MRWLVALVAVAVLGGCAAPDETLKDEPIGDVATADSGNQTATFGAPENSTGNATPPAAADNATGNVTGNLTGNQTANVTMPPPSVLVFEETFDGSLPVDGLSAAHPFAVPAGATRVEVTYTSDHIGLFTALATLNDAAAERLSSSDACGFGSTGAETDVCEMVVDEEVGPGEWSIEITWQVGQATEDYTFHVRVFGAAP